MSERRFHVFVRQHVDDSFTVSSLSHPVYAAYGRDLGAARVELARVLAGELALGAIGPSEATHFEGLTRRAIELTLRAVQHDRLIELPLTVTALHRPLDVKDDLHEVRLPRLQKKFTILGADNIASWASEIVRGHLHLADVDAVRALEHDRGERVEELLVKWRPIDGKRLLRARGAQGETRERRPEDEPDYEDDAVLDGMGSDLTVRARRGELGRCHHRGVLIERVERILASRQSVLLVGPSGVGKTALVHELAHRAGRPLWHVTPGRLMAGAIFLGQWQQRVLEVLEGARAAGAWLYLDSLLPLVSATQGASGTGLSLPRLIAPVIAQRELSVIVEASPDALSLAEAREPGFVDAMRRLALPPFDGPTAFDVLSRLGGALEKEHRVTLSAAALHRALDLIARFGDAEGLPGSGLGLLEHMARAAPRDHTLGPRDAIEAFSAQSGLPRVLVDADQVLDGADVEAFLGERVHGQPEAVRHLADAVTVLKAGLNATDRPVASFLFMGPTGVGKTESALSLAEFLYSSRERLVRLDMGEYGHPAAAARLLDGHGGEGDLSRPLRQQPFSIVLLDEIEKACGEVFDLLLGVLGEGRLTDGTGRLVSFRNAIVILTSNLGAAEAKPVGIRGAGRASGPDYDGAAKRFFRPELLNRLDHVVAFDPLSRETLRSIARRLLTQALERDGLSRRGVEVRYDEALLDHLADVGFDPALGARPMKRAIEARVLVPLAAELATRSVGSVVRLQVHEGAVRIA